MTSCDLFNEFVKASQDVKLLKNLDNETLLILYKLYKQSTVGDCDGSEPSYFDITGRAKYFAWKGLAGTTKDEAMKLYIEKVKNLIVIHG